MFKQIFVVGGKSFTLFLLPLMIALFFAGACSAKAKRQVYGTLERRLVKEGFSRLMVARALRAASPPRYGLVSDSMRTVRVPANYDHFLAPGEIAAARRFIEDHRSCFLEEKAEYGVAPGIIAAIMLVETHFGAFTGKTPTVAVFSSFAIMDRRANRNIVWRQISPLDRLSWGRRAFDKKLLARAAWAYTQLRALFELEKTRGLRLLTLRGSVMGAIGWPQFLPINLIKFGVDGNGDGRIDLDDAADAIFSTANYLRAYGWCRAKTFRQKEAVIFAYNHSTPYALTVLHIARLASRGLR